MAEKRNLCLVGSIARVVITLIGAKHSEELLQTLPEELVKTMLTSSNIDQVVGNINHLLRIAEDGFAQMMGFDLRWREKKGSKKKLLALIGKQGGEALPIKEEIVKERARFLSNLIRSIRGLKNYKPGAGQ